MAKPTPIDADQINEITVKVVHLVTARQIYRNTRFKGDKLLTELVILISNQCSKTLLEYLPLMDMVFDAYPDYCYRLYHIHQVKESIKKGNLFFYTVCNAENLCYSDAADALNLFAGMQCPDKLISKAKTAFNTEMAKIQAFNDGAGFYLEKENYALTAFMVHQQIELAYRAIELFAMGKDKVTHSIRVHQKHVNSYLPVLGSLFDESNEIENNLMQHLDDAYLKVRYAENYQINKDALVKAMEKGVLVQQIVVAVYQKMLSQFEQEVLSIKANPVIVSVLDIAAEENETTALIDDGFLLDKLTTDIIAVLTDSLAVECIYCINHSSKLFRDRGMFKKDVVNKDTQHFLLLVITKQGDRTDASNVQQLINQNEDIAATVTLLVHSIKNVNEALIDNNRFFHEVLRSDWLIYQNKAMSGLMKLPDYDAAKAYPNPEVVWSHRKHRALALLEAGVNMAEHEAEVVEISLLNQAMEQLCLGFIYASIGYKPNQYSLKYLTNICRCITPVFDEVIPTDTADDVAVFDTLIDSVKDSRYRVPYSVDPTDVGLLHLRCRLWMVKTEELIAAR